MRRNVLVDACQSSVTWRLDFAQEGVRKDMLVAIARRFVLLAA